MDKFNWHITLCILACIALTACTNSNVKTDETSFEHPLMVVFILTDNQPPYLQ